jgi:hypothetical protein
VKKGIDLMKHSVGPWKCNPGHKNDAEYCIFDNNGDYLTLDSEEHEANARIIEIAPDMFHIIQMAVNDEPGWLYLAKKLLEKTKGPK